MRKIMRKIIILLLLTTSLISCEKNIKVKNESNKTDSTKVDSTKTKHDDFVFYTISYY